MVIDDACVECDTGPINFKPTVMFQTRTFNFNLKNAGLSNVDYKWAVQTLDGANDTSGTYVVSCLAKLCPSLLLTSILQCNSLTCGRTYLTHQLLIWA